MGDNMENKKLTALEKQWILYDVGNSAFILLVATIMPIYFNSLCQSAGIAEVDYLAYWGYAASVSTLIVALSGPVLGLSLIHIYTGLRAYCLRKHMHLAAAGIHRGDRPARGWSD